MNIGKKKIFYNNENIVLQLFLVYKSQMEYKKLDLKKSFAHHCINAMKNLNQK